MRSSPQRVYFIYKCVKSNIFDKICIEVVEGPTDDEKQQFLSSPSPSSSSFSSESLISLYTHNTREKSKTLPYAMNDSVLIIYLCVCI